MIRLEEVGLPELLVPQEQPIVPATEYERRLAELRARVDADAIVIYADREHFANLAFLCGLDPRFEEALLVLGEGKPTLVLGTETLALASLVTVDVDVLHCPSLGLMGQDRARGLTFGDALSKAGVRAGARVAIVGWKYFEAGEGISFAVAAFVLD